VFALLGGAVILLALLRRRVGTAAVIAAILLGANVTTQVLKAMIEPSRGSGLGETSWPSGHTTAAMTVALCLVLASPVRWRPWAGAVGSIYVLAVGFSLMLPGWHFPSDVVGGMLVAGAWTGAAVALQRALAARRTPAAPRRTLRAGDAVRPVLLTAAGLVAAGAGALLARAGALSYLVEHTAFATGAVLTAGLALGLLAAASLVLTR
jgi:membrane-associated phospholipid phosphatase